MYCTNCGKQMPDGVNFCNACGAPLQKSNTPQEGIYQPNPPSQQASTPNQQSEYANQLAAPVSSQVQYVNQQTPQVNQQMPPVNQVGEVSDKSKTAAALLSIFLGGLGIHRFYVGKVGSGIAMLLLTIFGAILSLAFVGFFMMIAVGIWDLVDFIMILCGNFTDGRGRKIVN